MNRTSEMLLYYVFIGVVEKLTVYIYIYIYICSPAIVFHMLYLSITRKKKII